MALLSSSAVAAFGTAQMVGAYREAVLATQASQSAEAAKVAAAIRLGLSNVVRHVEAVERLPWEPSGWLDLAVRRDEYARLLTLVQSLEAVTRIDAQGRELLHVSRRSVDRVAGSPAPAAAPPRIGELRTRTQYRDGRDPVVDLVFGSTPHAANSSGSTVASLGMRAFALELGDSLLRPGSEVYVLDGDGQLILHRNPSVSLARRQVAAPSEARGETVAAGTGLLSAPALRSVVPIPGQPWRVVVEQPRDVVMAQVWATLQRTALFVALAVVASVVAALWLASRFTRPIGHLHTGAQALASGDLSTRIDIRTGDELEDLATQFNRMAESLQANVGELESRVAERTRQLLSASQHKSEFLAHMSHELRTPLNSILGFTDVLREGMAGPLSDEQREYLGDIHASGLHLLDLIQDVLDIAKIEAGRLELDLAEVSVAELVQSALAKTRGQAMGKKQAMELELAADAPTVLRADARRIQRLLINLLGNAVKFTPEGGRIVLRASASALHEGGLLLEVQDNGIGIAEPDLARIWEPFGQGGRQHRGGAEGAGLGLALVKLLAELHGGRVGVTSELGHGSRFFVDLPAVASAPPDRENNP